MATAALNAIPRTDIGKGVARKLRSAQQIPGVIYGHHREAQPLTVPARDLERMLSQISAENTIVELSIDGRTARTLIREIQRHPVKRHILHVDFQELVAGELVTVDVPVVVVGTAQGVRAGGTLDLVLREITVEVDPASIPNHIDMDVSALDLSDSLHVRDLPLPEGVRVLDDPDATVCVIVPPRVEVEAPAEAEVEPTETEGEPELIRKAKEEGEEEE